jgi:hypothetical protein
LTIAAKAVLNISPDGAEARYTVETQLGSSGAPVFTPGLDLVAINTQRLPDVRHQARGTGTLISAVLKDLNQHGFGGLLGRAFA